MKKEFYRIKESGYLIRTKAGDVKLMPSSAASPHAASDATKLLQVNGFNSRMIG